MQSEVRADFARNRLYVRYGEMTVEGYLDFARVVVNEARKLSGGFTILSDLRDFQMAKEENPVDANIREITEVLRELKDLGASETIRVVDPQVWLFLAMTEAESVTGYKAFVFNDFNEADEALDHMAEEVASGT